VLCEELGLPYTAKPFSMKGHGGEVKLPYRSGWSFYLIFFMEREMLGISSWRWLIGMFQNWRLRV